MSILPNSIFSLLILLLRIQNNSFESKIKFNIAKLDAGNLMPDISVFNQHSVFGLTYL